MLRRVLVVSVRHYAKKPAGGSAPSLQSSKKKLPVVTDPKKLATFCCGSNIRKDGQDIKLGEDSEYPEWLWELDCSGRPKDPRDLDPNTEEYWEALHRSALLHQNKLKGSKPKAEMRINEKDKYAKLEALIHRALAYKYYDPGHDVDRREKELARRKLN